MRWVLTSGFGHNLEKGSIDVLEAMRSWASLSLRGTVEG